MEIKTINNKLEINKSLKQFIQGKDEDVSIYLYRLNTYTKLFLNE